MSEIFWFVPVAGCSALMFAAYFYKQMKQESEGNETMRSIAGYVREGAMAYLKQQYKVVLFLFLILAVFLGILAYRFQLQNEWVPFAFLTSGFFSGLAGFLGMKTATAASARTAEAARTSLNRGLTVAFRSGAVMGLVVVGLALLDYSFWFFVLKHCAVGASEAERVLLITTTMVTFGIGASTNALLARVGGGIFTKAADVGADLVGKVEANIPEDDPRNPATIADNVGDNVGDVAGMGADLYESYYGSIIAAASLGAIAFFHQPNLQWNAVLAPALIGALGIVLSLVGIFQVRVGCVESGKAILKALDHGIHVAAIGLVILSYFLLQWLGLGVYLWGSLIAGLITGIVIGKACEYYTSAEYKPTRLISQQAESGAGPVVIGGLGAGMSSTMIPVFAVVIGMAIAFGLASQFQATAFNKGLYGIGLAAVGMLSTLGITLATDAYGPIADNAGGNAEMSGLPKEVRQRTDALDAIGNTTAATGKGFAIGSAALTALALVASYVQELKCGLMRMGKEFVEINGEMIKTSDVSLVELMHFFEVHLLNPKVLMGMFIGSMLAFVFCGLSMNAVGRAASKMVDEVRCQFREIKGILTGEAKPDYSRCVRISTESAQKEMLLPALLCITFPFLVGICLGVAGVIGLLAGTLASGFVLAIFMANAGGAWDNAKKYIEEGHFGGKGSEAHKAAVIGDTVGDPFKDTAGPSLNILLKLMTIASIVGSGLTLAFQF
ncbi:MAG: sodium-translocating pyrophosphatase [Opitutales bacterium]|nr:sodium-translocating pyrophosphatase [Opitutales bacterium]